ncbi:Nuclear speckle splicing regulatory protein 1 like protein [Argiope bruennichi]|uniref:Nuclear speckle splicing regulatory protein 1 like protein n=1 Tax=Argiope bruennichi TaxID=94029 RepID=A0A8T0FIP7_ARGBR|nr:Nuclear speckle splicing regulatory protein 1 like protein [Argiope bruennichi]
MDKSKPFGLVIPKKNKAFQAKKTSIFESDSDDEPASKKPTPIPQAKPLSKKLEQKELCEDPSIYEYDSIYDDMKAQEVAKIAGPKDNKPSRYIDTLLKAADKRKKEYERRIERKVQVEREKEGDKFQDKEAFVTSSYKKKMQEMEEAEERERRENMLNDMMDVTKQNDLSGFYRHFLKQSVGEEKIPVFGEKRAIKKEPKSDDDDKEKTDSIKGKKRKTLHSDEEKNNDVSSRRKKEDNETAKSTSKTSYNRPKMFKKGRSDSDDEETHNPSNEATNLPDPNLDVDSDIVSSCEEEEESNHSKSSEKILKDKISANNSEASIDNEKDNSRHKKSIKNIRKRTNDDFSDSSESSKENEEKHDSPVNETSLNGQQAPQTEKVEDANETEKPKPKKNWLEKRTVGELFAAAQARYFKRLAACNG